MILPGEERIIFNRITLLRSPVSFQVVLSTVQKETAVSEMKKAREIPMTYQLAQEVTITNHQNRLEQILQEIAVWKVNPKEVWTTMVQRL